MKKELARKKKEEMDKKLFPPEAFSRKPAYQQGYNMQPIAYDPESGVTVYLDYLLLLSKPEQANATIVYSIFNGDTSLLDPVEETPLMEWEDRGNTVNCYIGLWKNFVGLPPLPTMTVGFQIKGKTDSDDDGASLGWTYVDLFEPNGKMK